MSHRVRAPKQRASSIDEFIPVRRKDMGQETRKSVSPDFAEFSRNLINIIFVLSRVSDRYHSCYSLKKANLENSCSWYFRTLRCNNHTVVIFHATC